MGDSLEGLSGNKLLCFIVGLACWGAIVGILILLVPFVETQKVDAKEYTFLGYAIIVAVGCIFMAGLYLGVRGVGKQEARYKSGSYGHFFLFLLVLMGLFVVIPTVFWTGRGLLRKLT